MSAYDVAVKMSSKAEAAVGLLAQSQLEEGLAFAARCYMLRSRVAKFARMRVVEVGGGEVGREWAAAVERGWEGR